jgi:hypothetical protein
MKEERGMMILKSHKEGDNLAFSAPSLPLCVLCAFFAAFAVNGFRISDFGFGLLPDVDNSMIDQYKDNRDDRKINGIGLYRNVFSRSDLHFSPDIEPQIYL